MFVLFKRPIHWVCYLFNTKYYRIYSIFFFSFIFSPLVGIFSGDSPSLFYSVCIVFVCVCMLRFGFDIMMHEKFCSSSSSTKSTSYEKTLNKVEHGLNGRQTTIEIWFLFTLHFFFTLTVCVCVCAFHKSLKFYLVLMLLLVLLLYVVYVSIVIGNNLLLLNFKSNLDFAMRIPHARHVI